MSQSTPKVLSANTYPAPKGLGGHPSPVPLSSRRLNGEKPPPPAAFHEQRDGHADMTGLINRAVTDKDEKEREEAFMEAAGASPLRTVQEHNRWDLWRLSWAKSLLGLPESDSEGLRVLPTFFKPLETDDPLLAGLTPLSVEAKIDAPRQARKRTEWFARLQGRKETVSDHEILNAGPQSASSAKMREAASKAAATTAHGTVTNQASSHDEVPVVQGLEAPASCSSTQNNAVSNYVPTAAATDQQLLMSPKVRYCIWSFLGVAVMATLLQGTFDFIGDQSPPTIFNKA